jgi:hypothetical protein
MSSIQEADAQKGITERSHIKNMVIKTLKSAKGTGFATMEKRIAKCREAINNFKSEYPDIDISDYDLAIKIPESLFQAVNDARKKQEPQRN